jgi:hypothetical protein
VNCPYCQDKIPDEAIVCRTCRRDLRHSNVSETRLKALEDRLAAVEAEFSLHKGAAPVEQPAITRPPLLGVIAALFLMAFLDLRVGLTLNGSHSDQRIWVVWLLFSLPLGIWVALSLQKGWLFATGAAVYRAAEKTLVMTYCWSLTNQRPNPFLYAIQQPEPWLDVFLPEVAMFLLSFWLGRWIWKVTNVRRRNETQGSFENRVQRLTAVTTAITPILTFLAAILAIVLGKKGQ